MTLIKALIECAKSVNNTETWNEKLLVKTKGELELRGRLLQFGAMNYV